MKLFNKVTINEKAVWGALAVGASVLSLIAGQKNENFTKADITDEASKKAAEMVMEQLSKKG